MSEFYREPEPTLREFAFMFIWTHDGRRYCIKSDPEYGERYEWGEA